MFSLARHCEPMFSLARHCEPTTVGVAIHHYTQRVLLDFWITCYRSFVMMGVESCHLVMTVMFQPFLQAAWFLIYSCSWMELYYLIFKLAKPIRTNIIAKIQNLTTIVGSDHPTFSK